MRWLLGGLAALTLSGAAQAEVVEKTDAGFRFRWVKLVAAPPADVYRAIGEIGRWWEDAHTYSGKAANLSVRLEPGACWCEALPGGGGVQHGTVLMAAPKLGMVRFEAPLGPLQDEGVGAVLGFQLRPKAGGTEMTVTYNVGGARSYVGSMAEAIHGVLDIQVNRLARYAATGAP